MQDIKNSFDAPTTVAPASYTATVNGSGVDLSNFDSNMAVFQVGAITDGTHTPKIQESDDNVTFTDVVSTDQIGTLSDLAANTNQRVGYVGIKRYVRAVVTVSGATSGGVYGATVVRGHARKKPV
ncbi:hypothetical protein [Terrihalobacillus insolitus]|uniref:hypothetical protein n=1 Tax=Terrihalobacillus insolitus TaxID=2950438 RepID=UPI002340999C|nr:hypothetical protein [Terrihalobacillus insolitus]MDC3414272.1 hypothetical protein [Terrihalobacillus insolitus]